MARIRYIKPEFFEDTKVADISIPARLLYVGLWCYMDRSGLVEADLRRIKRNIYPYDDKMTHEAILALVNELIGNRFLYRVEHEGRTYLYCPKLAEHQKFHPKEEQKHLIPEEKLQAAIENGKPCLETASNLPDTDQPPTGRIGMGMGMGIGNGNGNGEGDGECEGKPIVACGDPPPLVEIWNSHCGSLPKVRECKGKRLKAATARFRERPDGEWWEKLVQRAAKTPFCIGENDRGWRANFDWLIRPDTATKILEGNYDRVAGGRRTFAQIRGEAHRELYEKVEAGEV